ncbi:MAG: LysM peptidoglycan-binding domain-containing protein [Actinomycetota bacterium]|nr:LysM peptidoglycan-binding domain-containing protein [Actinomycetota bacterium]
MVAVAHLSPAQDRRMVLVRSAPLPLPRPARAPVATYRRRRALALLAATTLLLLVSLAVQGLLGASRAGAPSSPARAATATALGPVYVVQPGDTFWDLARMLHPDGDPRPVVARLVAAHGSPVLRVGERIALPAP